MVSLLGPNGAGKTTTLLALAGLLPLMSGRSVCWAARSTPSGHIDGPPRSATRPRRPRTLLRDDGARAPEPHTSRGPTERERVVLDRFPSLRGPPIERTVGLLSGGEQQMLAIAVALLAEPKVLMVDEMSLGLAPMIVQRMLPAIRDLAREEGIAVVLVEQHVELALAVSDRAIVLNHGAVVLTGGAAELLNHRDRLETAYFGARTSGSAARPNPSTSRWTPRLVPYRGSDT